MLNTGFWQFWSSKIIGDSAFFLGPMKIRFKSWEYARISIQPSYLPFVRLTAWGYNAHRSGFVFHSQQPMSWVSEAQAGDMESMFQGKMLTVSKPWDRTRECMPNVVPTSNGWVNVSYWKLYPCLKTQSLSAMFCLNQQEQRIVNWRRHIWHLAERRCWLRTWAESSWQNHSLHYISGGPCLGTMASEKTAMTLQKMTQQADWWMIVVDPCIEGKHQRTIRFHCFFPTCPMVGCRIFDTVLEELQVRQGWRTMDLCHSPSDALDNGYELL